MSIVDPTKTILTVNLLEKDAAGIEEGAEALVRIDAHAERVFRGTVTSVAKLSSPIERGSPVKYFKTKVTIEDGDPALLKPGMKGQARIIINELVDAVVVPRAAVHGKDGDYRVLVEGADGPKVREIQLGPGNLVQVSVAKGLEDGERVLLGGEEPISGEGTASKEEPAQPSPASP